MLIQAIRACRRGAKATPKGLLGTIGVYQALLGRLGSSCLGSDAVVQVMVGQGHYREGFSNYAGRFPGGRCNLAYYHPCCYYHYCDCDFYPYQYHQDFCYCCDAPCPTADPKTNALTSCRTRLGIPYCAICRRMRGLVFVGLSVIYKSKGSSNLLGGFAAFKATKLTNAKPQPLKPSLNPKPQTPKHEL